jgi:hypothetical protein
MNPNSDVRVTLTDMRGRLLRHHDTHAGTSGLIQLNLEEMAAGSYLINIRSDDATYVNRLVVQ